MYQALYRKYRPRVFSDVVGQDHITGTLQRQVDTGRTSHAYLFVGTRGTGKTTCAKILARALNCEHPVNGNPCNECASCRGIESGSIMDVTEIDAASNNGVDSIRAIRDEAVYTPAAVRKRVYIIDEVHMLSNSAFNALLKILEEPPEHLVFILATTELNKIPATILSRCQRFSFRRISTDDIVGRLKYVAARENINITDGAASLLARLGDGSMRDALSLLDQCINGGEVTEEYVLSTVGLSGSDDTLALWNSLRSHNLPAAFSVFEKMFQGGSDPSSLLGELLSLLRDMMITKITPAGSTALITGAFGRDVLESVSSDIPVSVLISLAEALQDTMSSMGSVRDKRTSAEVCLVKLTDILSGQIPVSAYAEEIEINPPAPSAAPSVKSSPSESPAVSPGIPSKKSENIQSPVAAQPPVSAKSGSPSAARENLPQSEGFIPKEDMPDFTEKFPSENIQAEISGTSSDFPEDVPSPDDEYPPPAYEDEPPLTPLNFTFLPDDEPIPRQDVSEDEIKPDSEFPPDKDIPEVKNHGPSHLTNLWEEIADRAKSALEPFVFFQLDSVRGKVYARESGKQLHITAANQYAFNVLDQAPVKKALSESAASVLGYNVPVFVSIGPLPAEVQEDKLESLARFNNIKFE